MHKNKFIDFIITQKCTYSCEYCSQSKAQNKIKSCSTKETINNFLKLLDEIPCDYEITITGGEAVLHKDFFNLIKKIKEKNFKLSLITNFSFEIDTYKKIFELLDESLNSYSISFHLDEIKNFDKTIEKLNEFIKLKNKNTKINFLIPIYKINQEKDEKIQKIIRIANKNEINFDFQHIRILNKHIKYSEKETKYINKKKQEKSFAKLCNAGYLSAVIYEDGNAYRCYSSRFLKTNYLGNINDDDFALNNGAKPCTQKYCTCPKPQLYNQILDKKNYPMAFFLKFTNLFFLPINIVKKRRILKEKLIQFFKTN